MTNKTFIIITEGHGDNKLSLVATHRISSHLHYIVKVAHLVSHVLTHPWNNLAALAEDFTLATKCTPSSDIVTCAEMALCILYLHKWKTALRWEFTYLAIKLQIVSCIPLYSTTIYFIIIMCGCILMLRRLAVILQHNDLFFISETVVVLWCLTPKKRIWYNYVQKSLELPECWKLQSDRSISNQLYNDLWLIW